MRENTNRFRRQVLKINFLLVEQQEELLREDLRTAHQLVTEQPNLRFSSNQHCDISANKDININPKPTPSTCDMSSIVRVPMYRCINQ